MLQLKHVTCLVQGCGSKFYDAYQKSDNYLRRAILKICLAPNPGGHLVEMQRLMPALQEKDCFFVTHKSECSQHLEIVYFIEYTEGYIRERVMLLKTIFIAFYILLKERPDVVISTGGVEIGIPFCYVGKLLGAKVMLIESLTRTTIKSAADRLVYPIADLFLVQ